MGELCVRRARVEDRGKVLQVEALSTPNLRYLGAVFEHWVHDQVGELIVAELDGEMVGVGKLTIVPDGSAWLEALRVIPAAQGKGIGKRFYERFCEIAVARQLPSMRMYTGIRNAASKGLAERFGFHLAATFRGASVQLSEFIGEKEENLAFAQITDPDRASELLLTEKQAWNGFLVMNRTFYELTPTLCREWAREGKVYYEEATGSLLVLGARFQADLGLHIACLGGNLQRCLAFAAGCARNSLAQKLFCLFAPQAAEIEQALLQSGFRLDASEYIVMEGSL